MPCLELIIVLLTTIGCCLVNISEYDVLNTPNAAILKQIV
jgi:hypothetical protein